VQEAIGESGLGLMTRNNFQVTEGLHRLDQRGMRAAKAQARNADGQADSGSVSKRS
jgi:hypothetical protein